MSQDIGQEAELEKMHREQDERASMGKGAVERIADDTNRIRKLAEEIQGMPGIQETRDDILVALVSEVRMLRHSIEAIFDAAQHPLIGRHAQWGEITVRIVAILPPTNDEDFLLILQNDGALASIAISHLKVLP